MLVGGPGERPARRRRWRGPAAGAGPAVTRRRGMSGTRSPPTARSFGAPKPPPNPPVADGLYVAIGDSIAAGVVGPSNYEKGFAYVYFVRLQAEGVLQQLANRALNGATSATILEDQLPRALADIARPSDTKLVTVTVGTNDSAVPACRSGATSPSCPFAANLRLIVQRLQRPAGGGSRRGTDSGYRPLQPVRGNPARSTICCRPPWLGRSSRLRRHGLERRRPLHHRGKGRHVRRHLRSERRRGGRAFLPDGIHPNDAGHAALAQAFYAANTGR